MKERAKSPACHGGGGAGGGGEGGEAATAKLCLCLLKGLDLLGAVWEMNGKSCQREWV